MAIQLFQTGHWQPFMDATKSRKTYLPLNLSITKRDVIVGTGSGAAPLDNRRSARRQAFASIAHVGTLGRRTGERVRTTLGRGLRASDAARAHTPRPRLRSRGHATRRLRDHVGSLRSVH